MSAPRGGAPDYTPPRFFFRPVPGLVNRLPEPTAHAVGYYLPPSGLGATLLLLRLRCPVDQSVEAAFGARPPQSEAMRTAQGTVLPNAGSPLQVTVTAPLLH
jgi:hypothetical protein